MNTTSPAVCWRLVQLSGQSIFEAGTPLTITSSAAYPNGDWNADGTANDRPNAPVTPLPAGGYSRSQFLTGFLTTSEFPHPALGTDGTLGRSTYFDPVSRRWIFRSRRSFRSPSG